VNVVMGTAGSFGWTILELGLGTGDPRRCSGWARRGSSAVGFSWAQTGRGPGLCLGAGVLTGQQSSLTGGKKGLEASG